MGTAAAREDAVRRRLREDHVYFAGKAVQIVNKQGLVVPFELKRAQLRLARATMTQRAQGYPMRVIALKSRQIGVSTLTQSMVVQRTTQNANHLAVLLAQDRSTAGGLYAIGLFMWANLPREIKPPAARQAGTQDRKMILFGEPSQQLQREGILGLNSQITIATPGGLAGRGLTPRTLHVSEYAHWPVSDALLGIINGVPDDPDTLIVIESTPKGHNHFKDEWDLAVNGESGYYPFFSPWFEEEAYRRRFANAHDRVEFEQSLGHHPKWGDDEPALQTLIRESLVAWAEEDGERVDEETLDLRVSEHLYWRRWAIAAKCQGKLDRFKQEYSSTPEEAFLATGRRVFDPSSVTLILKRTAATDPVTPTIENMGPVRGLLRAAETRKRIDPVTKEVIQVPSKAVWVPAPRAAYDEVARWRLWQAPQKARDLDAGELEQLPAAALAKLADGRVPDGQYIVFCDPASGTVDEKGTEHAEHAIEVIDHRTREQVAEWSGQIDPDLVAYELLLVALYFNGAWVCVERTGGYGLSMLRKLATGFGYARVFEEVSKDKRITKRDDRLGWSTDHVSKPLMEAELQELVRLEKDGIKSASLARQMLTFIRDDRGRTKPEVGKLSDKLMAYMGAQIVASIRPLRPDRGSKSPPKKPKPKRAPRRRRTR